ncbi:rab-GTPase-TBC domain-domain-containing protein [Naematelia encephala]|uniref:Rab-GTPase-TBC domain-domain-containing protein n=1 Tax=Naematelia encephala TaxID=71784 RepID=A0A1Y2ARC2_9TREE|nr:rab-GTPase-TBC domain-domain-containing protein [Naematelia encephala]
MPLQPPTRPHSANPHIALNPSIFPHASTPSAVRPRPPRGSSLSSSDRHPDEWDDAWDSSSDKEDQAREERDAEATQARGIPIPIARKATADSTPVAASWASTSYQHVSHPSASTSSSRPALVGSKTFTGGAAPPLPGTSNGAGSPTLYKSPSDRPSGSKLPPGGAWEIVEESDVRIEEEVVPVKAGKESVREDVEDILRDPLQLLASLSLSAPSTPVTATPSNPASSFPFLSPSTHIPQTPSAKATPGPLSALSPDASTSDHPRTPARKDGINRQRSVRTERRREKFAKVLRGRLEDGGGVDLAELRRLAWSGIPSEVRPIAWQLLLNYLPLPTQPRLTTLSRKRKEYSQLVDQYFGRGLAFLDQQIWHQIEIDVPRTRPGIPLWSCLTAQRSLERILYVWAIRHPASGYVQGINDLVCPFFQVFLSAYIDTDPELFDVAHLPSSALAAIEADSFWCLSKLLDGIQDNYISHQPGIQRLVKRMSELVKRIDAPLAAHFEDQGVEFMQFAFRWMNCLLMREISIKCTIRMWDTYLAEGTDAFSQFHLYVCSALLVKYSERLREMDFQEMIIFLQCLPTHAWTDHDIELLLSEAYVLKTVWQGAENHFANLANGNGNGDSRGGFGMLGR